MTSRWAMRLPSSIRSSCADPPIPVVPVLLNALYPPISRHRAAASKSAKRSRMPSRRFPETLGSVSSHPAASAISLLTKQLDRELVAGADGTGLRDTGHAARCQAELGQWRDPQLDLRGRRAAVLAHRAHRLHPGYRTRAGTGMGLCFAEWR